MATERQTSRLLRRQSRLLSISDYCIYESTVIAIKAGNDMVKEVWATAREMYFIPKLVTVIAEPPQLLAPTEERTPGGELDGPEFPVGTEGFADVTEDPELEVGTEGFTDVAEDPELELGAEGINSNGGSYVHREFQTGS
jgi:hypothetical protein